MVYREAPPRGAPKARRLAAEDSFRWPKILLGIAMVALGSFFLWEGTWSSLECNGAACVLRQEHVLRAAGEFPFDARSAPAVVVEPAKIGKNGQGKRLLLRYPTGVEVELARDWGDGVEADARRVRAHFAAPRGTLSVRRPHSAFPVVSMAILASLGWLMLLDGLTLLGWRRVSLDEARRNLRIDRIIVGLRVKRESFPVLGGATVGRVQLRPDNPHFYWLTLESPGAPPQRLPLLDRPKARALVEEMIARPI